MIVYHGTILNYAINIFENGIDLSKSKQYLDFGRGFYATPDKEMAIDMAFRAMAKAEKRGIINPLPTLTMFDYNESIVLNKKQFAYTDLEWAKFIVANRVTPEIASQLGLTDHNHDLKYDVIIGKTADGDIARIAAGLRYGSLPIENYTVDVSDLLKHNGDTYETQITFCTEQSLSSIKYMGYEIIEFEKR